MLVPRAGFEPARPFRKREILSLQCLPVSPPGQLNFLAGMDTLGYQPARQSLTSSLALSLNEEAFRIIGQRFLYREQKFGGCVGNRTPTGPALVGSFALMLLRLLTVHARSS
jgi:hypothetical protein